MRRCRRPRQLNSSFQRFQITKVSQSREKSERKREESWREKKRREEEEEKERKALEHEMGDLLFSSVQLARWLGLSPEDCLRSGCDRFRRRFTEMSKEANQPLDKMSLDELDVAWESAKTRLGE